MTYNILPWILYSEICLTDGMLGAHSMSFPWLWSNRREQIEPSCFTVHKSTLRNEQFALGMLRA